MSRQEFNTAQTLREGVAAGWKFAYLTDRNALRAYSRHGVTIMTVWLDDVSADGEAEYFDILTPCL